MVSQGYHCYHCRPRKVRAAYVVHLWVKFGHRTRLLTRYKCPECGQYTDTVKAAVPENNPRQEWFKYPSIQAKDLAYNVHHCEWLLAREERKEKAQAG